MEHSLTPLLPPVGFFAEEKKKSGGHEAKKDLTSFFSLCKQISVLSTLSGGKTCFEYTNSIQIISNLIIVFIITTTTVSIHCLC